MEEGVRSGVARVARGRESKKAQGGLGQARCVLGIWKRCEKCR